MPAPRGCRSTPQGRRCPAACATDLVAPATRAELSDLLALLSTAPGRLALTGLSSRWAEASAVDVSQALQDMRLSSSQTRRQVYQAFRDLSNAAWFADAGTWEALGYPGPNPV